MLSHLVTLAYSSQPHTSFAHLLLSCSQWLIYRGYPRGVSLGRASGRHPVAQMIGLCILLDCKKTCESCIAYALASEPEVRGDYISGNNIEVSFAIFTLSCHAARLGTSDGKIVHSRKALNLIWYTLRRNNFRLALLGLQWRPTERLFPHIRLRYAFLVNSTTILHP